MKNDALLYHEPDSENVAVHASFVLLLNIIDYCLDRVVYCGLVGQIFLGIAWGTPGARLLSQDTESVVTNLGYLGLILLVFEGGLSTNLKSVRRNLFLSVLVAVTGILTPIGLSFLLINLCDASKLQAFAAGCALSSTSLGTTFTVLKSSGLTTSRLGTVLTSAAMLDDVVGLVLVQVITNIGTSEGGSISAGIIVRPALVSVAFAILVPAFCWVLKMAFVRLASSLKQDGKVRNTFTSDGILFIMHTTILFGIAIGGAYAGTSILFASYLAGAAISWFDEPNTGRTETVSVFKSKGKSKADEKIPGPKIGSSPEQEHSGFSESIHPPNSATPNDCNDDKIQETSVPRSSNNATDNVRMPVDATCDGQKQQEQANGSTTINKPASKLDFKHMAHSSRKTGLEIYETYYMPAVNRILKPFFFASIGFSIPISRLFNGQVIWRGLVYAMLMLLGKLICGVWLIRLTKPNTMDPKGKTWKLFRYQAQSYYPAALLGSAMVSRGEIGFLIAAVAQSNNIFEPVSGRVDLYLIATWAILACTIVGPVTVGLLAKRVRRLQDVSKSEASGKKDPLGIWAKL